MAALAFAATQFHTTGMTEPLLGRSINRVEDARFVRGCGRYIADLAAPNALHGVVVRSPHAHARIRAINVDAARRMPGVAAVLTGSDLASDHIGPLPCAVTQIPMTSPLVVPPCHALARDVVRYVGEPVAFVVADSTERARDAAEAVVVDYEPLAPVVAISDAVVPGAPLIWPEAKNNFAFQFNRGEIGPVEAAIASAAHVVECELVNNRVVAAPLETRGAIGEFDAASGRLHLTASAAGAHAIRDLLAGSVFHIPRERLRVSIPDVGGGFGMKNVLYPEWVLVLWAARRLGRPVNWIGDRGEDFVASVHGRDSVIRARLALDRNGRLLALDTKVLANLGAYVSTVAPVVPTMAMASAMGGVYDIPLIAFQAQGVFTNTTPVDAYRGAGKPEANYLIERLIDIAAAQLGIDALKLRRKNIISRFPYPSAMGLTLERGSFAHAIDYAVAAAEGFKARQKSSRARGRLRGLGYACFLETARGQPNEVAEVSFGEDGLIDIKVGTHSNGQGHETTYAQIAADALGLPLERFRFRQGDTDDLDSGGGHGGARSMHQGGTALLMAAEGLIENARRLAARLLQTGVDAVNYEAGLLRVAATGQEIGVDEVARHSYQQTSDDVAPGLAHRATHICDRYTFPNGCHVAEVEIDPATGDVKLERYVIFDDYGRLLDPRLTLGQVHGGVVQGIGQALFEHALYDVETGQNLSGSLMDYALPRADDIPSFEGSLTSDFPSNANRLGVKGSGQAGAIAAPATIMNAVMNALTPLGVTHLDMPATPSRIWHAIEAASGDARTVDLASANGERSRPSKTKGKIPMGGVLEGVRVLDFGRYIAGPYCATLLAEFGAEVIRVEKLDGSEDRFVAPVGEGGEGALFLQINRNKKCITLNPMKPEGQEVMRRLVATSDVVVANLPPQTLAAMKLDYESLKAIKPDIILTTATAFGGPGPWSDRVGFDGVGQVMSGAVYMTGTGDPPYRAAVNWVDFGTALHCAFGTLAALMEKAKSGRGQIVEGALLATALSFTNATLIEQAVIAANRVPTGNLGQTAAPVDIYRTRDGWVLCQVTGHPLFIRWAKLMGEDHWLQDPRFADDLKRGENGPVISERMARWCAERTSQEALDTLGKAMIPAGPVLSPQQALDHPHIRAAGFLQDVDYPGLPKAAPLARAAVRLSETPGEIVTRPPTLGEHTDLILAELGYDAAAIATLREKRIV